MAVVRFTAQYKHEHPTFYQDPENPQINPGHRFYRPGDAVELPDADARVVLDKKLAEPVVQVKLLKGFRAPGGVSYDIGEVAGFSPSLADLLEAKGLGEKMTTAPADKMVRAPAVQK